MKIIARLNTESETLWVPRANVKRTGEQTLCGSVSSLKRIEVIVENLTHKRDGVHILHYLWLLRAKYRFWEFS